MPRTALTYGYLTVLMAAVIVANLFERAYDTAHPDNILVLAYLCIAAPILNIPQVRIEQGRLKPRRYRKPSSRASVEPVRRDDRWHRLVSWHATSRSVP